MERPAFYFGNCVCCHAYNRLDQDGKCVLCIQQELRLIHAAQDIIINHPGIPEEEIATLLGVDVAKVSQWNKKGLIHSIVITASCPQCGRQLVNRFNCRHCGFNLINEMKESSLRQTRRQNIYGQTFSSQAILPIRPRNRFNQR